MQRDRIVQFLDELLQVDSIPDYGPQGLQVEGRPEVRKIAVGVSASAELFRRAVAAQTDLIICHHGMIWDKDPRVVKGKLKQRLKLLLDHDITLLAYHLSLDAHEEHGNNALIARALGLRDVEPFAEYRGTLIGRKGRFASPMPNSAFVELVKRTFGGEPLVFPFGPDPISTLGVVSGGAQGEVEQAIAAGLDAYLTGEASEFVQETAREGPITFVAAGHYRTETFGVRALGERLSREFGVESVFLDVPNPV
ncbi:MAG TPA: Nif3-like dinuclear metal center hexameric protein [bacterium]|nr:Nif3-like dinuclear metal center hexameric protein [bacterium]